MTPRAKERKKRKTEEVRMISSSNLHKLEESTPSKSESYDLDNTPLSQMHKKVKLQVKVKPQRQPQPIQASPKAPAQLRKPSKSCSICADDQPSKKGLFKRGMIQCDIETCDQWFHIVCLWDEAKDPRHSHIVLSHATGLEDNTLFIYPKCVDQAAGNAEHYITKAKSELTGFVKRTKRRMLSEDTEVEIIDTPVNTRSGKISEGDKLSNQIAERCPREHGDFPALEPAREEKYQGFDEAEIRGLMRKGGQSIFDYNKETSDFIERFGDPKDESLQFPLRAWTSIDPNALNASGENWYDDEAVDGNRWSRHGHLTASLRSMLHLEEKAPFSIPLELRGLTFSDVHTAFLGWFVIDFLENRFDLFQLPNMKSLRAMMAGVNQFGEARWPQMGKHVLREVHLRTLPKPLFHDGMLQNKAVLTAKLEAYMAPLTKKFNPLSHNRAALVESMLQLWTYIRPWEGTFSGLKPELGSAFDPELQDGIDEEGLPFSRGRNSTKMVKWVLRPGFRYREESLNGPREMVVKAIVIVE